VWTGYARDTRPIAEASGPNERAEAVTIVEVNDEASETEALARGGDVIRYLARHKVQVGPTIATG
jgi:hypothetical protein